MALPIRLKTILVLLLSSVLVCLGLANLLDRATWERAADGIDWVQTREGLQVASASPSLAAQFPDLKSGLRLVSVNDIPVGALDDLTEIREFLSETLAGSSADYLLQDGQGNLYEFPIVIQYRSSFQAIDFFLTGVAIAYLVVGLFIFLRSWNASGAFHFYLLCLVSSTTLFLRHSGRANTFDLVIYIFDVLAFVLLPALFLHFCLTFPRPHKWSGRPVLVYLPASFLGVGFLFWLVGGLQPLGLPRTELIDQLQQHLHLLHFSIFFLLGALVLADDWRNATTSWQRQQMKWISGGATLGILPLAVFYAAPYLLGWPINAWMELSVLSLVLIPLSFGYAITRYRLMDVDLIFKRSAAYVLASSVLLGMYVGLVVIAGRSLQHLSPDSGFLIFALTALAVAFLFAPLNNWIQRLIDRHFYKDQYDYRQSLTEFAGTLHSEVDLNRLCKRISQRIEKTLGFQKVGIFLREHPRTTVYRLHQFNDRLGDDESMVSIELADQLLLQRTSRRLPHQEALDRSDPRGLLRHHGFAYIQPLKTHDRIIGFLAVGSPRRGEMTTSEDLELLGILADYASIAIDNALLYGSLETNAAELSELKVYNENVIESIRLGVMVLALDGTVTIWNDMMRSITEREPGETVGKHVSRVLPESILETLRRFFSGDDWNLEKPAQIHKAHLVSASGRTRMVDITLTPFLSALNYNRGVLLVFDDITDKVQLENQLLQAERLSSIGLFAAGVAHEVNTPLAGISSYIQMLIKKSPESDPNLQVLQKIEQQSFRASNIVNSLLNFARVGKSDIEEVNLNTLVLETLSLLDHPFKKVGVEVTLDFDPGLPSTLANGGKLQQVFMNLFLNARDAMPDGGHLTISTRTCDNVLQIRVQDDGAGISQQHIRRIYDPFFTTKDVGEGTGLGLSVSYGIIQEHSGRIHVDSRSGKGTTFTIELPLQRVN